MTPNGNQEIVIEDRRFRDLADLEDYCHWYPDFENVVVESGLFASQDSVESVNTYLAAAELEYGDGNIELPYDLIIDQYEETLIDKDC